MQLLFDDAEGFDGLPGVRTEGKEGECEQEESTHREDCNGAPAAGRLVRRRPGGRRNSRRAAGAPEGHVKCAAMAVDLITSDDALEAIAPEWLNLWRRMPDATPFQSPMWLLPWWRHFGSNDLSVITVRGNGELEALAPLYVVRDEDESLGLLLGTGNSDYLDLLGCDPDGAITKGLSRIDCRLWDLHQLRPSSPLLKTEIPDGWNETVEEQEPCLVLPIAGAGEELQNLISTHFRKKLRYYRRNLAPLSCDTVDERNLDSAMDALFTLHAARWERRGMPGMLADNVAQRFHRQVARAMLDAGALRMYTMRSRDRVVAVFYGFASGDTVYYYLSGYDPDLEKLSPGTLIVAHAIEQAVRAGVTTFDFLRGAEEYKHAWGAKDRMNHRRQLMRVG